MEANTVFLIIYFVSMVITFVLLCYMGLDSRKYLTYGDMLQISLMAVMPLANTVFAIIMILVMCLLADTPIHRWLQKPALMNKKREEH